MTQIVVNRRPGGFGLSHKAIMLYAQKIGITLYAYEEVNAGDFAILFRPYEPELSKNPTLIFYGTEPLPENGRPVDKGIFNEYRLSRTDPVLIEVIKELGEEASGKYAKLEIITIPDDVKWKIEEDSDGFETIEEVHRSW